MKTNKNAEFIRLTTKIIGILVFLLEIFSVQPVFADDTQNNVKKIAFITAMQKEFDEIRKLYPFKETEQGLTAQSGDKTYFLVRSGMGKVNAAIAAERLCRQGVDLIISVGVAGGVDSSLKQGDTVISNRVGYHDVLFGESYLPGQVQDFPQYFETPLSEKYKTSDTTIKKGLIVTGDQFVTDQAELKRIKTDFPDALAVDMESAAIAQVCYINHVNFLSVRMISDVIGSPQQEEMYNRFWENYHSLLADKVKNIITTLLSGR